MAVEDSAIVAIDPIDTVTIQIFEKRLIVSFQRVQVVQSLSSGFKSYIVLGCANCVSIILFNFPTCKSLIELAHSLMYRVWLVRDSATVEEFGNNLLLSKEPPKGDIQEGQDYNSNQDLRGRSLWNI